jgi:GNAT superfamily N-acetyltransferase
VDVRPATEVGDGAGIAAVRRSLGDEHDDSGASFAYRAHLLAHGQLWVATDGDRVVGFAGTRDIAGARMLSDLFIDPSQHGRGIGRTLLVAVMDGSTDRLTFSSSDPRALPLYLRAGMMPRWPLLYLEGTSVFDASSSRHECTSVETEVAVAAELHLSGSDRSIEYAYWMARPHTSCVMVGEGAVGVVRHVVDGVRVEHLCVADGIDPGGVARAIGQWANTSRLLAYVRGTSPLARTLLDAGYRVVDADTAMSTRPELAHDTLHVIHPGLL